MKELYTKPDMEIELFITEDIITSSGDGDNDVTWPEEWGGRN